tara:strand:+ start:451 stop:570 length:120 start_codon:yes stop_codon:yes gene_type:complete
MNCPVTKKKCTKAVCKNGCALKKKKLGTRTYKKPAKKKK